MIGSPPRRLFFLSVPILALLIFQACGLAGRISGETLARDLQQRGEKAEAEIVGIWDTGVTVNDDPVVGFVLNVRPSGRPAYEARTKLRISRLDVSRVQPGAIVAVRIDPNDPSRVALDIYKYR